MMKFLRRLDPSTWLAISGLIFALTILLAGGFITAQAQQAVPVAHTLTPNVVRNPVNATSTSGANAAQDVPLANAVGQRTHLYYVSVQCSAGSAEIHILDSVGGTVVWKETVGASPAWDSYSFPTGITSVLSNSVVARVTTCGIGNTSTVFMVGDRF